MKHQYYFFCGISDLQFYLNENELRKNCYKNHYEKGMKPNVCYFFTYATFAKILAQVRNDVRQLYGNCQTLH